ELTRQGVVGRPMASCKLDRVSEVPIRSGPGDQESNVGGKGDETKAQFHCYALFFGVDDQGTGDLAVPFASFYDPAHGFSNLRILPVVQKTEAQGQVRGAYEQ